MGLSVGVYKSFLREEIVWAYEITCLLYCNYNVDGGVLIVPLLSFRSNVKRKSVGLVFLEHKKQWA